MIPDAEESRREQVKRLCDPNRTPPNIVSATGLNLQRLQHPYRWRIFRCEGEDIPTMKPFDNDPVLPKAALKPIRIQSAQL